MSDFSTPETCESGAAAQPPPSPGTLEELRALSAKRVALVLGFWAAVAILYWPSSLALDRLWRDWPGETYTHGYLVLLVSIWLILRSRKQLAVEPVRGEPLALIPLGLMSAAWIWLWRSAIQEPQLLLLPLILYAALVSALGRRIARVVAFPIGFLYFAMPLWSDINGIVQGLSAKATGVLISMTGIPAYMAGNMAHLPGGLIEIAQSCSGLHTFVVGLALAALYGKVSGEPWRRRLTWLISMGLLSLVVNWVRIFTVIVAAYESDMRSSLVKQHYWLGWWLFAIAFAGFLWWTGRRPASSERADSPAQRQRIPGSLSHPLAGAASLVATLAVLAALPVLAYGMDRVTSNAGTAVDIEWPGAPAGWAGPAVSATDWKPYFVNPSSESLIRYSDPQGGPVEAFAVVYRVQTQNAKLLSYWNHVLGRSRGVRQESARVVDSAQGRWRELTVNDVGDSQSLIWLRYRIGNRLFVEPRASQLWYGLAAVLKPPVSSLTALRTPCLPDCGAARARLSAAATWLRPTLH